MVIGAHDKYWLRRSYVLGPLISWLGRSHLPQKSEDETGGKSKALDVIIELH